MKKFRELCDVELDVEMNNAREAFYRLANPQDARKAAEIYVGLAAEASRRDYQAKLSIRRN